jgi:hypothetical protein
MPRISLTQLRNIIAEEVNNVIIEGDLDHTQVSNVGTAASKLLTALDAFNKAATGAMVNAVTPHADSIKKVLIQMVETPGAYVDKNASRKVTFKATKEAK